MKKEKMMRSISLRVIKKVVPEFQSLNEVEMIHPSNDLVMKDALQQFGFDVTKGVWFEPSYHRDDFGDVGIGYRAVGTIDPSNREFITSRACDSVERIVAAAVGGDIGLMRELSLLSGIGSSIKRICDDDDILASDSFDDFCEGDILDSWGDVSKQIAELRKIRDFIRGHDLDEYGNVKRLGEL